LVRGPSGGLAGGEGAGQQGQAETQGEGEGGSARHGGAPCAGGGGGEFALSLPAAVDQPPPPPPRATCSELIEQPQLLCTSLQSAQPGPDVPPECPGDHRVQPAPPRLE